MLKNDTEIEAEAFDWACDYKPWEDDLSPQEYAEYGFKQGYLRAKLHILRDLGVTEIKQ